MANPPFSPDPILKQKGLEFLAAHPTAILAEFAEQLGLDKNHARAYFLWCKGILDAKGVSFEMTEAQRMERRAQEEVDKLAIKKQTIAELITEALQSAYVKVEKRKLPPRPRISTKAELECITPISDVHCGKRVRLDDVGGLGQYDVEIFVRRLAKYQAHLQRLLAIEKGNIKRLWVPLLGDLVDGTLIYRGQRNYLDPSFRGVIDQVVYMEKALTQHLLFLSELVPEVIVGVAGGNHARIGIRGESHWKDNFDFLVFDHLRRTLENAKRIKFEEPRGNFIYWEICGWSFYGEHGDKIRSWGGIPFYGVNRTIQRIHELVENVVSYFLTAHHHERASFGRARMNGNWIGADDFSAYELKKGGCPSQEYYEVHPEYGISVERTIYLEKLSEWGSIKPTGAGEIE